MARLDGRTAEEMVTTVALTVALAAVTASSCSANISSDGARVTFTDGGAVSSVILGLAGTFCVVCDGPHVDSRGL
jgi:hypothetical protein